MIRVSSAKVFRKEESISKKYLSKNFSTFFFFGDLDVNFVATVFDPNIRKNVHADFYGLSDIDSVVTDFDPNSVIPSSQPWMLRLWVLNNLKYLMLLILTLLSFTVTLPKEQ